MLRPLRTLALLACLCAGVVSGCAGDTTTATTGRTTEAPAVDSEPAAGPADPSVPVSPGAAATTVPPPSVPPTPTPTPQPGRAGSGPGLQIAPGSIGPLRVGMTRSEWLTTGLLEDGAAICEDELVRWVGQPPGFSVLTDPEGTITQLTVSAPGPRTDHRGLEVGSTYAELRDAFPTLTEPVDDGFDQSSVHPPGEEDGLTYLGFLLADPPGSVDDQSRISAIAVTGGGTAYFQHDC